MCMTFLHSCLCGYNNYVDNSSEKTCFVLVKKVTLSEFIPYNVTAVLLNLD